MIECPECYGECVIECEWCEDGAVKTDDGWEDCDYCYSYGIVDCPTCYGEGEIEE